MLFSATLAAAMTGTAIAENANALAVSAAGAVSTAITPTSADRQAFESGVRQQQAINIFSDPRGCGIVLMRLYCKDAVLSLIGSGGEMPGIERFVATGNVDYYDRKWADANTVAFSDAAWKANPRQTWLRAAGVEYASYYVPDWEQYSMMQVLVYRQIVQYASSAAPYDSLLLQSDLKSGSESVDAQGPARIAKYLVPALGSIFPARAQPAVNIEAGGAPDAQLGVYASTAQEMFESPVLFLAPSSRAFLNDVSTDLGDANLGQQFISASNPDEWRSAIRRFDDVEAAKLRSLPGKRKDAFLFGMMAAQAAYNAAVLRDKAATDQHLTVLQNTSRAVPAAVSSKLPATIAARDDWHALNETATALTLALMRQ